MEPTEQELRNAMRICRVSNQTIQKSLDLSELQRIRDRKTTWFGASENALRIEIDRFLRNGGGGFDAK